MSFEQRAEEIIAELDELEAASAADQDKILTLKTQMEEIIGDDIMNFIDNLLTETPEDLADRYPAVDPVGLTKQVEAMTLELRRANRRDDVRMRRMKNLMREMSNFGDDQ